MMLNAVIGLMSDGYDPDARVYFNHLVGRPSEAFKSAINTFILSLKSDGNWTEIDRLWLHATEQQQHARVSIVNPASTKITEVNSPTWAAGHGYTGNGTNMYLNFNYNPAVDGVKYASASRSHGAYVTSDVGEDRTVMGQVNATSTNQCSILPRRPVNTAHCALGQSNASVSFWANSDSRGMFAGSLSGTTRKDYKNGAEKASYTIVVQPLLNFSAFGLGRSSDGSPDSLTTRRMAISYYGSASIDQSTFYSAIQTLATTLGFNV